MSGPSAQLLVCGSGGSIGLVGSSGITAYKTNARQRVKATGAGGTVKLAWGGYSTAGLAVGAAASDVQTALQGLTSIGSGNVTVTGQSPWEAEFTGTLAGAAQPLITVDISSLLGSVAAQPTTAGTTAASFCDSSGANFTLTGSSWNSIVSGYGTAYSAAALGNGDQQARYVITGLATGWYRVLISLAAFGSSYAASVPVYLFDGTTPRGKFLVNQQTWLGATTYGGHASNGFQAYAAVYATSGNPLVILVTDEVAVGDIGKLVTINEVAADPLDPTVYQLWDPTNTANYFLTGGGWTHYGDGWDSTEYFATASGSTALCRFDNLVPGWSYTFQANYVPAAGRATVTYSILDSDGVTVLGTSTIDQTTTPTGGLTLVDSHTNTWTFQVLGTFTPTGPVAYIRLPSAASGATITIAYLVKLVSTGPATEAVTGTVTSISTGPLAVQVNGGSDLVLSTDRATWNQDGVASQVNSPQMTFALPGGMRLARTDVVTAKLSNNSVFTTTGPVPGGSLLPVTNRVGQPLGSGMPNPVTMGVGFNGFTLGADLPFYADSARNTFLLDGGAHPPTHNANNYPLFTGLGETALNFGYSGYSNPFDSTGYPMYPAGGVTTIKLPSIGASYPLVRPGIPGTAVQFVSLHTDSSHISTLKVILNLDGSGATVGPQWQLALTGLQDFVWAGDTGRVTLTGGPWVGTLAGWNGSAQSAPASAGASKAVYALGVIPAGTYQPCTTWSASAGNTTTANYVFKEAGVTKTSWTVNQRVAPAANTLGRDYNYNVGNFQNSTSTVTLSGGACTLEVTGGTDGFLLADGAGITVSGTIGTPYQPWADGSVHVFDPLIPNPASPPTVHPVYNAAVGNARAFRTMQQIPVLNSAHVNPTDFPTASCLGNTLPQQLYQVTQVSTLASANSDGYWEASKNFVTLTLSAVGSAPLPIPEGVTLLLPPGLGTTYVTGGGVVDMSNLLLAVHRPAGMATNQVSVCAGAVSGSGAIVTVNPSNAFANTYRSGPTPADVFAFVASKPHCVLWLNLNPVSTQATTYALADAYAAAFPPGSTVYLEGGNEGWNSGFSNYQTYFGVAALNSLSGGYMAGYAMLSSQHFDDFRSRLGARGSEVKTIFTGNLVVPSVLDPALAWCTANSKQATAISMAVYLNNFPYGQSEQETLQATLPTYQLIDILSMWLNYGGYYQSNLAAWKAKATGSPSYELMVYEGSFSAGALNGTDLTQRKQSFSMPYDPLIALVIEDYLTLNQGAGVTRVLWYNLDQPQVSDGGPVISRYGLYNGWFTIPGKGDGSDGLHDNRPDIAGGPPTPANLLTAVSPTAQQILTWNGAIGASAAAPISQVSPNALQPSPPGGTLVHPNGSIGAGYPFPGGLGGPHPPFVTSVYWQGFLPATVTLATGLTVVLVLADDPAKPGPGQTATWDVSFAAVVSGTTVATDQLFASATPVPATVTMPTMMGAIALLTIPVPVADMAGPPAADGWLYMRIRRNPEPTDTHRGQILLENVGLSDS